ncbi:replication-associated recombination protein A, partial [Calditrichota bacterium]
MSENENIFSGEDESKFSDRSGNEKSTLTGPQPLANRMRPRNLDDFVGQDHLVGVDGALRPLLESGNLHSMIFWGSPGVGKTTLARLLAGRIEAEFIQLSAVTSGVADVRKVIERGLYARRSERRTVLFIDEIHRFNKAQQDALLHAVEDGTIILIGATTENPSFEVIAPLLSRCRVYRFDLLSRENLEKILEKVLTSNQDIISLNIKIENDAREALLELALGDARELLNLLERSLERAQHIGVDTINLKLLESVASQALSRFDKQGDMHYDTISAFIKCVRNSDPDAAVYWLARMLEGGEDPLFIARRLIILASEDIGNANPNALLLAQAGFEA